MVDQVVFDLSTPNDPSRLQNVADDILMIQKIINKLLISEQKERNVFPLKNVTNLIETNNLIKK